MNRVIYEDIKFCVNCGSDKLSIESFDNGTMANVNCNTCNKTATIDINEDED